MKPRIFIAIHYLEVGGAESSLIGLLEALDPAKVDIDLFVYAHHGLYMSAIPEYVNLLPENKAWAMLEEPMARALKKGFFKIVFARLLAKYKTKKYYKTHPSALDHMASFSYLGNTVAKVIPSLKYLGKYDLAISYVNPHDFVLRHVDAKKKICWIHTDYSRISINDDLELPIWRSYDRIISISPDVTASFTSIFPSLRDKVLECENMLPQKYINTKSLCENDGVSELMKGDRINICSIGRISYAKNYDNIPHIAKELKNMGLDFRWFIVGPGNHDKIDSLSQELGVAEIVHFVGASDNPYIWLKKCDYYVHPSRYEGKSIVVREAQILCKPVIITNYPTAHSQIRNGVDGIICGMENREIAEAIYELDKDGNKKRRIIDHLKASDFTGAKEVEKIYSLLYEG